MVKKGSSWTCYASATYYFKCNKVVQYFSVKTQSLCFKKKSNFSQGLQADSWTITCQMCVACISSHPVSESSCICLLRDGVCSGSDAGRLPLTSAVPWTLQHVQAVHARQTNPTWPKTLLQGVCYIRTATQWVVTQLKYMCRMSLFYIVHILKAFYIDFFFLFNRLCSKLSAWMKMIINLVWQKFSSDLERWCVFFICLFINSFIHFYCVSWR